MPIYRENCVSLLSAVATFRESIQQTMYTLYLGCSALKTSLPDDDGARCFAPFVQNVAGKAHTVATYNLFALLDGDHDFVGFLPYVNAAFPRDPVSYPHGELVKFQEETIPAPQGSMTFDATAVSAWEAMAAALNGASQSISDAVKDLRTSYQQNKDSLEPGTATMKTFDERITQYFSSIDEFSSAMKTLSLNAVSTGTYVRDMLNGNVSTSGIGSTGTSGSGSSSTSGSGSSSTSGTDGSGSGNP